MQRTPRVGGSDLVLVDTSIWNRYFAGRLDSYLHLDELLKAQNVVAHPMVLGELLIGDPGGRKSFLAVYEHYNQATLLRHHHVVEFVKVRRLHGRGIGWIDAHLLASAVVDGTPIWTADSRLKLLAKELSLAYAP